MKDIIHGGKADYQPDKKYPTEQILKGMKAEREHTDNPQLAKEIAKDHLEEDRKYYNKLEKMEKKAFWGGFIKTAVSLKWMQKHLSSFEQKHLNKITGGMTRMKKKEMYATMKPYAKFRSAKDSAYEALSPSAKSAIGRAVNDGRATLKEFSSETQNYVKNDVIGGLRGLKRAAR